MNKSWTFGQKVGAGFAATMALGLFIGVVSIFALRTAVASKDRVIVVDAANLIDAQSMKAALEWQTGAFRGFLLLKEERFLNSLRSARENFVDAKERMGGRPDTAEVRKLLGEMEAAQADYHTVVDKLIQLKKEGTANEIINRRFEDEAVPRRDALKKKLDAFISLEDSLLEKGKRGATESASFAIGAVAFIMIVSIFLGTLLAFLLTRTLSRQISQAVQHVQNSSSELQAAANQQASGAKEQASSMNEISTTINELLATSRQIAESAQRVAQISGQAASSATSGDQIVQKAQESIGGIKNQVDVIVHHMLDLGKRSQQIGGILEIINELAEQTNILSINATVEAAGAGEAGKRFAVVADEIRKLADRVGGSTKEIRSLIDEVRAAVNTTVMATEGGAKAVDAGSRQFSEVAASFKQITGLVTTSTEAAKEIELSTKQQTTAVEQVNVAISDVAQASKETEASSAQTLQTATLLTTLSHDLSRLIQPHLNGHRN